MTSSVTLGLAMASSSAAAAGQRGGKPNAKDPRALNRMTIQTMVDGNPVKVIHEYRGEKSGTELTSMVKAMHDGLPKPTGAHSQHPAAASEAAPTARSRWSLEKRQEDNKKRNVRRKKKREKERSERAGSPLPTGGAASAKGPPSAPPPAVQARPADRASGEVLAARSGAPTDARTTKRVYSLFAQGSDKHQKVAETAAPSRALDRAGSAHMPDAGVPPAMHRYQRDVEGAPEGAAMEVTGGRVSLDCQTAGGAGGGAAAAGQPGPAAGKLLGPQQQGQETASKGAPSRMDK